MLYDVMKLLFEKTNVLRFIETYCTQYNII
jgi:hypothetical protein